MARVERGSQLVLQFKLRRQSAFWLQLESSIWAKAAQLKKGTQ